MIEIDRIAGAVVRVVADSLRNVEITIHPGGGVCIHAVDDRGVVLTVDGFPTVEGGSDVDQILLDSLGRGLSIRLEVETLTGQISITDPDDVTAAPDPGAVDPVPMLEFVR